MNFLKHLLKVLNKQLPKANEVHSAVIGSIVQSLSNAELDVDLFTSEMNLATADGYWLDYWGGKFDEPRNGSDDTEYRYRIIAKLNSPKCTIPALKKVVSQYFNNKLGQNQYSSTDVKTFEPWTFLNMDSPPYTDYHPYPDPEYWRYWVVHIMFCEFLTDDLRKLLNTIKAGGIKIWYTFEPTGMKREGTSTGWDRYFDIYSPLYSAMDARRYTLDLTPVQLVDTPVDIESSLVRVAENDPVLRSIYVNTLFSKQPMIITSDNAIYETRVPSSCDEVTITPVTLSKDSRITIDNQNATYFNPSQWISVSTTPKIVDITIEDLVSHITSNYKLSIAKSIYKLCSMRFTAGDGGSQDTLIPLSSSHTFNVTISQYTSYCDILPILEVGYSCSIDGVSPNYLGIIRVTPTNDITLGATTTFTFNVLYNHIVIETHTIKLIRT